MTVCLSLAIDVTPVSAVTIVVNSEEDDNVSGDGECSLREAIKNADSTTGDTTGGDCTTGSSGGTDTITLPAGTYTLTLGSRVDIVWSEIVINGENPSTTIVQASTCNPVEESCGNDHQFVWVNSSGTLTLNNLTLRYWKNTGDINGGAMLNQGSLNINNCILTANKAVQGGGIANSGGTLSITNSTFSNNAAHNENVATDGGAISNTITGTVNIENSTFSNNNGANGGGIKNWGILEILNSTFSGNTAELHGGAINNAGTTTVTNGTFSENGGTTGAGIFNGIGDTLNIINTIIANSVTGNDCNNLGTIGTNSSNLIETGNCDATFPDDDPNLGALADNGGPTQTHALLQGSIAIDNGDLAACPETDQRGVPRPQGNGCDIGAYEKDLSYFYLPLIMK
jgi:CSLREA domain-containing protein